MSPRPHRRAPGTKEVVEEPELTPGTEEAVEELAPGAPLTVR